MADQIVLAILLTLSAVFVGGTSFYRLVMPEGPVNLSYAGGFTLLTAGSLMSIIRFWSGGDPWGSVLILLAGGAWVIAVSDWGMTANKAQVVVKHPILRGAWVFSILCGIVITEAWLSKITVNETRAMTRTALDVHKIEIEPLNIGDCPILNIKAEAHHRPEWARVTVQLFSVDKPTTPVYEEVRESTDPNNRVGKSDPEGLKTYRVMLNSPLNNTDPGRHFGLWLREEKSLSGITVRYPEIMTRPFMVNAYKGQSHCKL